ncbi:MAG: hypothetical protein LBP22_08375 [Deltaproteobacteria bacterium]|jgi:hypothetical protein|nr:hypothetical protein [Deltaproteobacteria bacterium]
MPACFSPAHLVTLDQAAHLAGDLVSEEFQLDLTNFKQWPVDVRHYPDLAPSEVVPDVLAQVLCYRRETVLKSRNPDFYRVCLYDPNILQAAQRESVPLLTLLTYIVTHEFIHVSRFIRFFQLFSLDSPQRAQEEILVHVQTRKLLAGRNLPDLPKVLDLFERMRIPLDNPEPKIPDVFPDNVLT